MERRRDLVAVSSSSSSSFWIGFLFSSRPPIADWRRHQKSRPPSSFCHKNGRHQIGGDRPPTEKKNTKQKCETETKKTTDTPNWSCFKKKANGRIIVGTRSQNPPFFFPFFRPKKRETNHRRKKNETPQSQVRRDR